MSGFKENTPIAINIDGREKRAWALHQMLAATTLFGCILVVLTDILMWFLVPGYNPIRQTISELGAGHYHWLMDGGILAFVVGMFALAGAIFVKSPGGWRAWATPGALIALGATAALIALWNEYGDREPGGLVIHQYLVAALYALVAFLLWIGGSTPPVGGETTARRSKIIAAAWIVLAPFFYIVPESVNGAYERALAALMVGAAAFAGWRLLRLTD